MTHEVIWDTETSPFTDQCVVPPLACISYAPGGLLHWSEARPWVVRTLLERTSIGHNIAFDMAVVGQQWPELIPLIFRAYDEGRVLDTMLAQQLIDIASGEFKHRSLAGYGLAELMRRHFKRELDKDTWRLRYGEFRELPLSAWPDGAKQYPIDDADGTRQLWFKLSERSDLLGDLRRQARHAFALQLVSAHGITTDTELVERNRIALVGKQSSLAETLFAAGILRPKSKLDRTPVKTIKVIRELLEKAGSGKLTDKGSLSTDKDACEQAALSLPPGDPIGKILAAYSEYSSIGTRLSSQYPYLARGELHVRFKSLQDTGRTASGKPYNLQNPPRGDGGIGERECFIPRPGTVFADLDYEGLELRTQAQMYIDRYGFSKLADALNAGIDPHLLLAADQLLKIPYADAIARKKEQIVKDMRQLAKPINFGLPGGMGAERLRNAARMQYGVVMTLEEAQRYKPIWLKQWPEAARHLAWASAITRNGPARVQQLRTERWRGGLGYCDAANTLFQGLGADAAKDALYATVRAMYDHTQDSVLLGSRVVNFVHDQIIAEVPEVIGHECAQAIKKHMIDEANKWLPDVPATTVPCLSRRWSKGATDVYDEGGRLIPWEHPKIKLAS